MLKRPQYNAIFIAILTAFYSFLFLFIADHAEFLGMVHPKTTLQWSFINRFTDFLVSGDLKYFGYAFILTAAAIVVVTLLRHKKYDEYQRGVLAKCTLAVGILTVLMVPVLLLCILSDPNYSLEFIFLFIIVHWSGVLITDLVYTVKYAR